MTLRTIGPWKLGDQLGRGGQSSVFKATRAEGTVAAVKVIGLSRPKRKARFIQELKIHALLSEKRAPNVIPVLDHNLEDVSGPEGAIRGYIAMPVAVCSLDDRIGLYNLRTEFCLETFIGITNGIQAAHQHGAIHRDIKPANVLFLDETLKEPMVSDFGICFLKETLEEERLTEHGETVGARFFMAPEQERGGVTDVNEASDIYALGKLLHYMITSRYLYREELGKAFQESEIAKDERLRSIRDEMLVRMIVEDPSKRIQSADEVLEIARKVLGGFGR
ncbi:MAG TPA: serine/threonine-protein kinase [Terriglobales bacterium]|nr:serine/threonine-protein kinase [Terriglobales bacterium]